MNAVAAALVDVAVALAVIAAFVGVNVGVNVGAAPASIPAYRRSLARAAQTLARLVVTVAVAVVGVGAAAAVVPGDPVARALGEDAPESARAQMAETLGLHHKRALAGPLAPLRPLAAGGRVARGLVTGIVAPSQFISHRGEPVWALIGPRLLASASLGLTAVAVGVVWGIVMGVLAAMRRRAGIVSVVSVVAEAGIVVGAATPRLVFGPALVFVLAVQWRLVPAGGDASLSAWCIPLLTLSMPFAAVVARHVRAAAVAANDEAFVRSALARGASPSTVALRHVLPHALVPVVQLTGLQAGAVLSGALIVERVTSWPGLATLLLERLQRGDLPVVMATVAVSVVIVVGANAAATVAVSVVDPRSGGRP